MLPNHQIPVPILFNPLKHHLGYIREFIELNSVDENKSDRDSAIKELKHIGGSVMDIYSGSLSYNAIGNELLDTVKSKGLSSSESFRKWAGGVENELRTTSLSDGSVWILKYFEHERRFVHSFPARFSPLTFRIKANTLKSAVLYEIFSGKDFVSEESLNATRAMAGLSPVRDVFDTEAIIELIEILRG